MAGHQAPVLLSVNVGMPRDVSWQGKTVHTGAWKYPVDGPAMVRSLNIDGDGQGDTAGHGGEQRAVLVYQVDSYRHWQRHFGRDDLGYGQFGENLTTQGLDLTGTLVGERWRIGGTVVLQATSPRIPCATFAHRMGEPKWVKRFTARGATGTYLRVVVPGEIRAGDRIEVIRRPQHTVTISRFFRALTTEAHLLPSLLEAGDDLPLEERDLVLRRSG